MLIDPLDRRYEISWNGKSSIKKYVWMKGLKQYKSINEYKSYFESSLLMVYLIFLDDSPLPITKVNLYRDKVKSAADPQLTAIKL